MQLRGSRKVISKVDILDLGDVALLVDFRDYPNPLSKIHQLSDILFSLSPVWLLDLILGIDSLMVALKFSDFYYQNVRIAAKAEIETLLSQLLSKKNERSRVR